jgi:GTPase SAR1 family protein
MSAQIAKLKQHLESLFPGQWINPNNSARTKTLFTGLTFLDQGLGRGIARQRISAWVGPASCGKTSLLRSIISHWLACSFRIVYIDTENNLLADDWTCFEEQQQSSGKFWMVRVGPGCTRPCSPRVDAIDPYNKNIIWSVETLTRSNIFDVVIVDLNASQSINWRSNKVYARWQNSLSKSKTALLLLTDNNHLPQGWNFYTRLEFSWATNIQYSEGLRGKTMILPSINCRLAKDGLAQNTEVPITAHVANRLFTHPPAADRRSTPT